MSPARMAKVSPVMPNVEPPLSAYLEAALEDVSLVTNGQNHTGRNHAAWHLRKPHFWVSSMLLRKNMMGFRREVVRGASEKPS